MEGNKNHHNKFSPEEEEQMWENILAGIRAKEGKKRIRKTRIYTAVTASVILLFISGIFSYNHFLKPDIYIATTEKSTITLSDGSVVTLLKGAKLRVEKSFPADIREVYLTGDAIFKVAKSKEHPFIVHGLNYETRVLGTVFKVIQDGGTFKVDLFEGRVAVKKTDAKKEYFMMPNQTFSNYGKPDVATIIPLKDDQNKTHSYEVQDSRIHLSFNGSNLKDVIEVVEKTYHIKVEYPAQYADYKISLDNLNFSPTAILGTIAGHLDLNLNIDDTTYRLEK